MCVCVLGSVVVRYLGFGGMWCCSLLTSKVGMHCMAMWQGLAWVLCRWGRCHTHLRSMRRSGVAVAGSVGMSTVVGDSGVRGDVACTDLYHVHDGGRGCTAVGLREMV